VPRAKRFLNPTFEDRAREEARNLLYRTLKGWRRPGSPGAVRWKRSVSSSTPSMHARISNPPPPAAPIRPTPTRVLNRRVELVRLAEKFEAVRALARMGLVLAAIVPGHLLVVSLFGGWSPSTLAWRPEPLERLVVAVAALSLVALQAWNVRRAVRRPVAAAAIAAVPFAVVAFVVVSGDRVREILELSVLGASALFALLAAVRGVARERRRGPSIAADPLLESRTLKPHAETLIEAVDGARGEGRLDWATLAAISCSLACASVLFRGAAPGLQAKCARALDAVLSRNAAGLAELFPPERRAEVEAAVAPRLAPREIHRAGDRQDLLEDAGSRYDGSRALVEVPLTEGDTTFAWRRSGGEWVLDEVIWPDPAAHAR
jgi:hypothetical protein